MFRYNFIFNPHYVQLNIVIMYEDWLFFGPLMRSDCRIANVKHFFTPLGKDFFLVR